MQPVETVKVANTLGECVLWDDRTQALWWTDIEGCMLYRLDWAERSLHRFRTPQRLASFGFVDGRPELIAAFDDGFALFNPETGHTTPLIRPVGLSAGMRLNDGRVDRQGRFWAGSMVFEPSSPQEARLYLLHDGAINTCLRGLSISNGLCWSPDGMICYFADSRHRVIWQYGFDGATGRLGERRFFARTLSPAVPDGAVVDAAGCIWSAQWDGGRVVRYAPDGRIDRILELPVTRPTCVTFGGPKLDLLFVTSARLDHTAPQTGAGDVLVYNMNVQGLPESRFRIEGWPGPSEG